MNKSAETSRIVGVAVGVSEIPFLALTANSMRTG